MKTAIITGGGQGIGRVTTQYLLTHGYRVAIWEADTDALTELRESFKASAAQILFVSCDVSSEVNVRKAVEQTMAHFGQIDALINNAAIMIEKSLDKFMLDEWNRVISTNLTGPFLCAKHTAPYLAMQKGCIINICSTRAFQSEPDTFAYSASKGGLLALTHSLAVSLGPDVRVNAISPGWIDVSALKKKAKAKSDELRPEDHSQHPAGRVGQADDIARMILFLIAPENSFITGQNFVVDGGMTRKMIYV
ncbi:SDR family oxidoreductase [Spirosoma endophyticum]|uniref:NAD(P)-dependent dehydrogenase, short-chain alcohol dehydrogenase family n=1 Tax=Spirosoma endophyticum TaxID=662367 RepID=A0A1I2CDF4_9BACT|nr:SDR family oxidoreductase [Spirosoma endophyticum]SFE65853.1 NAD(P)-dependent dehydrogenase, short-chain alcohol dehydrogenase family [Spirosoma endophyticum]